MDKADNISFDFSDLDLGNLSIDTVELLQANESTGVAAHAASCANWITSCSCSLSGPNVDDWL